MLKCDIDIHKCYSFIFNSFFIYLFIFQKRDLNSLIKMVFKFVAIKDLFTQILVLILLRVIVTDNNYCLTHTVKP